MLDALREVKNGVQIRIWVVSNSKKTSLEGYDRWKNSFTFKTTEPAEKEKANKAIVEFFEKLFRKEVVLANGARSKSKTILVLGATLSEASGILRKLTD